jgi:hypothetical protein
MRSKPPAGAEEVAAIRLTGENRVSMTVPVTINYENGIMPGAEY